jgi:hypothetical protein
VTAAGGTLGVLIPPSIPMILYRHGARLRGRGRFRILVAQDAGVGAARLKAK